MGKGKIVVRLKGDFYCMDTYCDTLKEFMETYKIKRSEIKEWWRN